MSRILGDRLLLDEDGLLGPSPRYIIWFHGCDKHCPGCIAVDWNKKKEPEFNLSVRTILETIKSTPFLEGVTISGGEPFLQVDSLLELIQGLRSMGVGIIVYTGYQLSELINFRNLKIDEILMLIDVLVDGRYISLLDDDMPFRGSSNQIIHQFTNRYANFFAQNSTRKSIIGEKDGQELLTGIPDNNTKKKWAEIKTANGLNNGD